MRDRHGDVGLDAAGARAHHDDAARHEDRLLDVVRDEQHRGLLAFPDREQELLHQPARLVVERAERLVEQQDLGRVGERAGDRRALLHAARQHLRVVALEAFQPHLADPVPRDRRLLGDRQALLAQPEAHVLLDGEPREQRVALEHHAAVRAGARHLGAVEQHAALGRPVESRDEPQQRGLAAARGSQNRDEVVVGDGERDGRERERGRAAMHAREGPADAVDDELAHTSLRAAGVNGAPTDTSAGSPT